MSEKYVTFVEYKDWCMSLELAAKLSKCDINDPDAVLDGVLSTLRETTRVGLAGDATNMTESMLRDFLDTGIQRVLMQREEINCDIPTDVTIVNSVAGELDINNDGGETKIMLYIKTQYIINEPEDEREARLNEEPWDATNCVFIER